MTALDDGSWKLCVRAERHKIETLLGVVVSLLPKGQFGHTSAPALSVELFAMHSFLECILG